MVNYTPEAYALYLANQRAQGKLPPVASTGSEAELHAKILDECDRRWWIALHGSMAHITHRCVGEPDFIILADAGRTIYVECKTAKGKLSIEQQAMAAHANKLGHAIHLVRSIEEFLAVVNKH